MHRFLARVYRLVSEQPLTDAEPSTDQLRLLHQCIKKARAHAWDGVPAVWRQAGSAWWCRLAAPAAASQHPSHGLASAAPPPLLQVTEETEEMRFNTALAAMMEFVNVSSEGSRLLRVCLSGCMPG